jgi:alpha/beta superfamily hydrolase
LSAARRLSASIFAVSCASAGVFDDGRGEVEDLAAVVAEGRRRFPGAALWLGGFSFGAFVALRAGAALRPAKAGSSRAAGCPLRSWQRRASGLRLDARVGRRGRRGVPRAVLSWAAAEQPRKPRLHVLAGAGHFFHGNLHELKPLVVDFLRR